LNDLTELFKGREDDVLSTLYAMPKTVDINDADVSFFDKDLSIPGYVAYRDPSKTLTEMDDETESLLGEFKLDEPVGKKYDGDKTRWDLLPIESMESVVKVLTMGATKYGDNNWQLVDNARERYYAAAMRHLVEWRKGNKIDNESGESHLAHVMCNMVFLMHFDK
jgi:Domain of unknown function (DUF5664)